MAMRRRWRLVVGDDRDVAVIVSTFALTDAGFPSERCSNPCGFVELVAEFSWGKSTGRASGVVACRRPFGSGGGKEFKLNNISFITLS